MGAEIFGTPGASTVRLRTFVAKTLQNWHKP
jgi:hypothetical protein